MLAVLLAIAGGIRATEAQTAQAVLFFSPTCQHCHQVITGYLPALFREFGGQPSVIADESVPPPERGLILFYNDRLQLLLVDASKAIGSELYMASARSLLIPPERGGVPRLVIGDEYMVGAREIPLRTGDLVRQGLEHGGIGWPVMDGLDEALASVPALAQVAVVQPQDVAPEPAPVTVDSAVPPPEETPTSEPAPVAVDSAVPLPEETPTSEPAPTAVDSAVPPPEETPMPEQAPATPPAAELSDLEDEGLAEVPADTAVEEVVEAAPDSDAVDPSAFDVVPTRDLSMIENFQLDPVGNGFSVVVLVLMIVSVIVVWVRPHLMPAEWSRGLLVPVFALIGVGVAGYLTYIEATGVTAVCGPVGDCNTVNQSEYARLFGVLPVGALGLMGYVAIALGWAASRYANDSVARWAIVSLLAMATLGTLFSIYLTFLEPFVIGATCAWCLTSSILITAQMWLSSSAGQKAWTQLRSGVS